MLTADALHEAFGWTGHLSVPATSAELVGKAIDRGSGPTKRLLEAAGISAEDVAAELDIEVAGVRELLGGPVAAPVVVVDGEDSIVATHGWRQIAIASTVEALASRRDAMSSRRPVRVYFRTSDPGPEDDWDVAAIVHGLADRGALEALGGVVMPKVARVEHVASAAAALTALEAETGQRDGTLGLLLLVEGAAAYDRLTELAAAAGPRLAGLIFGVADYAADLGLPSLALDHPVVALARARLIEAAAATHVPAFDGMTLVYPVIDPALPAGERRARVLEAIGRTYRDALTAFELGMTGKWLGHPAQLFALELAVRRFYSGERIDAALRRVRALADASREGRGVAVDAGLMLDRATDRQARTFLARAAAAGRFEVGRIPLDSSIAEPALAGHAEG